MTRITETIIESFAIEQLANIGYDYIYAPNIAPDSETPERSSFDEVIILNRFY